MIRDEWKDQARLAALAIVGVAVAYFGLMMLSGCGDTKVVYLTPEEAKARKEEAEAADRARTDVIQRQLPPGCVFKEYGSFESRKWRTVEVAAIYCGKSVTTNLSWSSGKSRYYASIETVDE